MIISLMKKISHHSLILALLLTITGNVFAYEPTLVSPRVWGSAAMNDIGEAVWVQSDAAGYLQIYSNIRGELTTNCPHVQPNQWTYSHTTPSINNLGDVVWEEYDGVYYQIYGLINGAFIQITTDAIGHYSPSINDVREIVWHQYDAAGYNQIFSNIRGQITSGNHYHSSPSINNLGDVVWHQTDEQYINQIYRLIGGEEKKITSGSVHHMDPSINDLGEIVWSQEDSTGKPKIFSSSRGQLTFDYPSGNRHYVPAINICGDVIFTNESGTGEEYIYRLGSSTPCGLDTEPNNSTTEAITILSGSVKTGLLDSSQDTEDWYTFTANAGDRIKISVNWNPTTPNQLAVDLLDTASVVIASATETGTPKTITTTAAYTGTYYVRLTTTSGRFGYGLHLAITPILRLSMVHIASSNSNSTYAKVGDTVTLTITASEAITQPTVKIGDHAATVTGSGVNWTAAHVMSLGDADGAVTIDISNYADLAGNLCNTVTSTTDGSSVTFDKTAPITMASPVGSTYPSAKNVTLTANESAVIYYTLDGAVPTTSSNTYSGPISITGCTIIKFFAVDQAGNSEAVRTESYVIDSTKIVVDTGLPSGPLAQNNIPIYSGQIVSIRFTVYSSVNNATISAYLKQIETEGVMTATLSNSIGPGTTESNIVAQQNHALSLSGFIAGFYELFTNIDLSPGTYYMTLSPAPGESTVVMTTYLGHLPATEGAGAWDYANSGNTTIDLNFPVGNTFIASGGGVYNLPLKMIGSTIASSTAHLTVSKAGTGAGSVTSNLAGITCGTDCSELYDFRTEVTLTATPSENSEFSGWSGDTDCVDGIVTINAAKTCIATFALKNYLLTVNKTGTGTGTITSNPAGINYGTDNTEAYTHGTSVTFSAIASSDSRFTGWAGACTGTGTCTIAMDAVKTATANFDKVIEINDGAALAATTTIHLDLNRPGATKMRFMYNNSAWSVWEPYNTTKTIYLPAGDGIKTVYVQFDNDPALYSDTIVLDAKAPKGTVIINDGAPKTYKLDVKLTLTAADDSDIIQMCISATSACPDASWEAFSGAKDFTLAGTAGVYGTKYVYAKFKDSSGRISYPVYDSIQYVSSDKMPPEYINANVIIDGGKPHATKTAVTLTITNPGAGIYTHMKFSNDGLVWTAYELFKESKIHYLTAGDGQKTVFVKFRTSTNVQSDIFGSSIILDTKPPTGTIIINNGAITTNDVNVTATLEAVDINGVADMCFSTDGIYWTLWEPYATSKNIALSTVNGTKRVFVKFRDNAGKISTYYDSIILDTKPPVGRVVINGGAATTSSDTVTLSLYAPSAVFMLISADGGTTWGEWEPYATTKKNVILPSGSGAKAVAVKFKDFTGNVSNAATDTINRQ